MRKIKNLTGLVFGRLIVVSFAGKDKCKNALWNCSCECGNDLIVLGASLTRGGTKSCGCLRKERASETHTIHGLAGTPQYQVWWAALDRTINPNNKDWADYGGRGIEMCDKWKYSPQAFWQDMGPTWQKGLTLDREDTNGHYCPENCRWATESVQMHNQRKRKGCSSQYKGVYFDKPRGKFRVQIYTRVAKEHLGCFINELDAALAYDNRSEEIYGDRPNGTIKINDEDNY